MTKAWRRLQGRKAQSGGQGFEDIFERKCRIQKVICTRMPPGGKNVGKRFVRIKTPFDWVLSYQKGFALIDTKTCNGVRLPNSKIEKHQIDELVLHESSGVTAGYVIWTRQNDRVFFLPASELVKRLGVRGSCNLTVPGAIDMGSLETMDVKLLFTLQNSSSLSLSSNQSSPQYAPAVSPSRS